MNFTEQQIESLAPNPAAFLAGKKLSSKEHWLTFSKNERAIWGEIKGSGKSPYLTQIDTQTVAFKCTCPSRQFPCKHSIALMLLQINNESSFKTKEEPEWVKGWMDKRVAKEKQKSDEPVERTEEEEEQLEKNREKTQVNRLISVKAGVAELELWLKDLVRIGILELPKKNKSEFERIAARMVDAKAPGLAGWIKSYTKINYDHPTDWQQEALQVTAKLFLLVRALRNYDRLSPLWQQTVRNLAGWSQSPKELLVDKEAETVKDDWLVAGQEIEVTDDEVTVQRNWLIGCSTNRTALILNFGTKFTSIESTILPGTVIQGELAFFPSVLPQRAIVKMHRKVTKELEAIPRPFNSWADVQEYITGALRTNPLFNDHIVLLKGARMINPNNQWLVCDENRSVVPVIGDFDFEKTMKWLAITGNRSLDMALVLRNDRAVPLGVLQNEVYHIL